MRGCTPSQVYVFGRSFKPSADQMYAASGVLFKRYRGVLTPDHFHDVDIALKEASIPDRKAFFEIVPAIQAQHPKAHIVDLFVLDEEAGKDMVIIAVWDGARAETGRLMFAKKWWQFWR